MPRTAKKPTRKKLVQKLDTVFSRYVRMSNADHRGFCECVTCKKKFHWKNIQAGHFMSRKHYSTRWDEQNVFPQCVGCNVYKNGEQYKYSLFLGSDLSEEMHRKSNQIVKYSSLELDVLINKYTELVKELEKKYIWQNILVFVYSFLCSGGRFISTPFLFYKKLLVSFGKLKTI